MNIPDGGTNHDRLVNAAINIGKFALDKQNINGI
jgi:transposase